MTTLTQRLVDRALDGDPTAQRTLVAELTPTIQWSVAKMLRRWRTGTGAGRDLRQEVEDMVQEVFVELFEKQLLEGGFARSVELLVYGEREVGKEVVPLPAWEADLSTVHAGPFVYLRRLMAQGRAKPP